MGSIGCSTPHRVSAVLRVCRSLPGRRAVYHEAHVRFELFIAARYLRARRRQAVVGLITGISILGVAAGVASLILALAITNGMRRDLQDRLVGATAHVELLRVAGDGIRDWPPVMARLARVPHVRAVAPGLYGQVLISRGPRSGGALVKGIVPADELRIDNLLQSVDQGSYAPLDPVPPLPSALSAADLPTPPIVLGHDLAATLGAEVGETILITSPQGELTPLGITPRYQRFEVVGIFASGFYSYDSGYAFIRLADAQHLFSEPDLVSVLSFRVDDLDRAPEVARALQQAAGPGFEATPWQEQNRELFRALRLEQAVTFVVLALIVVVAALNILSALTMMVMEKTRDIAVMMSFGVTSAQVRRIFLLQGVLIAAVGTVLGLVLGYLGCLLGARFPLQLDPGVYSIDHLPFAPRAADALLVAAVSLGISLLATLYPSHSAAGVLPAEALRYE